MDILALIQVRQVQQRSQNIIHEWWYSQWIILIGNEIPVLLNDIDQALENEEWYVLGNILFYLDQIWHKGILAFCWHEWRILIRWETGSMIYNLGRGIWSAMMWINSVRLWWLRWCRNHRTSSTTNLGARFVEQAFCGEETRRGLLLSQWAHNSIIGN